MFTQNSVASAIAAVALRHQQWEDLNCQKKKCLRVFRNLYSKLLYCPIRTPVLHVVNIAIVIEVTAWEGKSKQIYVISAKNTCQLPLQKKVANIVVHSKLISYLDEVGRIRKHKIAIILSGESLQVKLNWCFNYMESHKLLMTLHIIRIRFKFKILWLFDCCFW